MPANTSSPTALSRGIDSPVMADSSSAELPSTTRPSSGTRWPGRIRMRAPARMSPRRTEVGPSSVSNTASLGARARSESMARSVRWRANPSRAEASENKNSSRAPSSGSPMIAASPAPPSINTSISSLRARIVFQASCRPGIAPMMKPRNTNRSDRAAGPPPRATAKLATTNPPHTPVAIRGMRRSRRRALGV